MRAVGALRSVVEKSVLNVRPAFSEGVTARLSGQMSSYYLKAQRGFCKAPPQASITAKARP